MIRPTRELIENTIIILAQLRASQITKHRVEILSDKVCDGAERAERLVEKIRDSLLRRAEAEAG